MNHHVRITSENKYNFDRLIVNWNFLDCCVVNTVNVKQLNNSDNEFILNRYAWANDK